jgi:hypothetical protein
MSDAKAVDPRVCGWRGCCCFLGGRRLAMGSEIARICVVRLAARRLNDAGRSAACASGAIGLSRIVRAFCFPVSCGRGRCFCCANSVDRVHWVWVCRVWGRAELAGSAGGSESLRPGRHAASIDYEAGVVCI